MAGKLLRYGAVLLFFAVLFMILSWPHPTHNPAALKAIVAESRILMRTYGRGGHVDIPIGQWPPAIASLKPEFVSVSSDGVDIVTKPYFDGGWGYMVPQDERIWKPWPERYSDLGHGIYWYHPY